MIGRMSPEKRIEDVIDAKALTETKPVLRVVGGLIPTTMSYKESLERRAREKGVKVEFYPNVTRGELLYKLYLLRKRIPIKRLGLRKLLVKLGLADPYPASIMPKHLLGRTFLEELKA